jgi:hypothetical protein
MAGLQLELRMPEFTALEKYEEIVRELKLRRAVYPRLLRKRKLDPKEAERQIAILKALADDLLKLSEKDRLL